MHPILADILQRNYAAEKAAHPHVGRRALVLSTLHKHWPTVPPLPANAEDLPLEILGEDPFDDLDDDEAPGILIRADYSNDAAWDAFYLKFKDAEREILEGFTPLAQDSTPPTAGLDHIGGGGGDESENSSESYPTSIVKVLNPSIIEEREYFENISNIAALRLVGDVDLRPAPPKPLDMKKIPTPSPLMNKNDWQEIHTGKIVWIYDKKSAIDECVRLVSSAGDLYGTATGDSWRARVSHICELQFNMTYLGMKVDFGGLDRWDFSERQRNLNESDYCLVPCTQC